MWTTIFFFFQCFPDDRVENLNILQLNINVKQTIKTKSGREINCDLIIDCTGTKPNNEFYKEELGTSG